MKVRVPISNEVTTNPSASCRYAVGKIIRGKVKEGSEVVIRYRGKVEIGVVVRTKRYSSMGGVRFGDTTVILRSAETRGDAATPLRSGTLRGPISKAAVASSGNKRWAAEIKALSSSQY